MVIVFGAQTKIQTSSTLRTDAQSFHYRIPSLELPQLLPHLITYNSSAQQLRFSQTSYNCEICLTSIKGARCILLSCSHVFCRGCLEDFWKLCISEGDVSKVGCPDPHCVKEGREANEEEVRRVVTEQEIQRWKWLKKKREWENGDIALVTIYQGTI